MPYFNAASHSAPHVDVYKAMVKFLEQQANSTPTQAMHAEKNAFADARDLVADVISANVQEIGLTTTTTAAWQAVVGTLDLGGKRILIAEHEWGDFYRALAKRPDIEVQVLPSLDLSKPDLSAWEPFIDEDVAAIFVPLLTSASGARYPVEKIGLLPRPSGTKFIVDAAQGLGQTNVNVGLLNCDAIVSTCRKWMRGPRQTALFWLKSDWLAGDNPLNAQSLAPADQNVALMIGLGVAAKHLIFQGQQAVEAKICERANSLRVWARSNGLVIYGGGLSQSGIVSFDLKQSDLDRVSTAFNAANLVAKVVEVSVVEPCLHLPDQQKKVLRLSPHTYTTDEEMDQLKELILEAIFA